MVGGFSFDQSQFNRATQALRQPGSSFKPFVYAAALDNGYTPSSVVLDAPIEIDHRLGHVAAGELRRQILRAVDAALRHRALAQRHDGAAGAGPRHAAGRRIRQALRHLRQSAAVLSLALGAGETTLLRMVAAYAMFANGGKKFTPTLIDRIQDRYGQTIYRHDQRECRGCDAEKPGRTRTSRR